MSQNLKKFMKEVGLNLEQNLPVSMHSFRSGGAISKFLERQPLEKIMYDAVWKNPQTMWKYMKILEVLSLFKQNQSSFNPDFYHVVNTIPLLVQARSWQAYHCSTQDEMLLE